MKTTADITAARQELWAAIAAVMTRKWGAPAIRRLAREAGVAPATISRMKNLQVACTLDVLVAIAAALYVDPWELLLPPGRQVNNQPDKKISPQALDLARSLDQISDQFRRAQAYSLAMHAIQAMGGSAAGGGQERPPDSGPTPGRQAAS